MTMETDGHETLHLLAGCRQPVQVIPVPRSQQQAAKYQRETLPPIHLGRGTRFERDPVRHCCQWCGKEGMTFVNYVPGKYLPLNPHSNLSGRNVDLFSCGWYLFAGFMGWVLFDPLSGRWGARCGSLLSSLLSASRQASLPLVIFWNSGREGGCALRKGEERGSYVCKRECKILKSISLS